MARVTRPGIGVEVDPAAVKRARTYAMFDRLQLSEATAAVDDTAEDGCPIEPGTRCAHGRQGNGVSRDEIAKLENGERPRPRMNTVRLIVLAVRAELIRRSKPPIGIEDLVPDVAKLAAELQADENAALREQVAALRRRQEPGEDPLAAEIAELRAEIAELRAAR